MARLTRCVDGELADAGADGGEAVLARRGEIRGEVERGERIGIAGGDFDGGRAAEKFGDEQHEAANERGIGVGVEVEQTVTRLGGEPYRGDAAVDSGFVGADRGERRLVAGAADGEREAFVSVVDRS